MLDCTQFRCEVNNIHIKKEEHLVPLFERNEKSTLTSYDKLCDLLWGNGTIDFQKEQWIEMLDPFMILRNEVLIDELKSYREFLREYKYYSSPFDLKESREKQKDLFVLLDKLSHKYVLMDLITGREIPVKFSSKRLATRLGRIIERVVTKFYDPTPVLELMGDMNFRLKPALLKDEYKDASKTAIKCAIYGRIWYAIRNFHLEYNDPDNKHSVLAVMTYFRMMYYDTIRTYIKQRYDNNKTRTTVSSAYVPGKLKESSYQFAKSVVRSVKNLKFKLGLASLVSMTITFPEEFSILLGFGDVAISDFLTWKLSVMLKDEGLLKQIVDFKALEPFFEAGLLDRDKIKQGLAPSGFMRIEDTLSFNNGGRLADIRGNKYEAYFVKPHAHIAYFLDIPPFAVDYAKLFQVIRKYTLRALHLFYTKVKSFIEENGIENKLPSWKELKKKMTVNLGKLQTPMLHFSVPYLNSNFTDDIIKAYKQIEKVVKDGETLDYKALKQITKLNETDAVDTYGWLKYIIKPQQYNYRVVNGLQYEVASVVASVLGRSGVPVQDIKDVSELLRNTEIRERLKYLLESLSKPYEDIEELLRQQASVWITKRVNGEFVCYLPELSTRDNSGSQYPAYIFSDDPKQNFFVYNPDRDKYYPVVLYTQKIAPFLPEGHPSNIQMFRIIGHHRKTTNARFRRYSSKTYIRMNTGAYLKVLTRGRKMITQYYNRLKERQQNPFLDWRKKQVLKQRIKDLEELLHRLDVAPLLDVSWTHDLLMLALTIAQDEPGMIDISTEILSYLGYGLFDDAQDLKQLAA